MVRELTYLACPYTHHDPEVRLFRFIEANKAAAQIMSEGIFVVSPLSHSHPIALAGSLPLAFDFWMEFDFRLIRLCDTMTVLKLDGWTTSVGVSAEIRHAVKLNKLVKYREPSEPSEPSESTNG